MQQKDISDSPRDRSESILAVVPEIITEVDNHKIYTWMNEAGVDFFGPEAIGKEASFYFEGEQDTYAKVSPIFQGDSSTIYLESWQRRKDGEKRLLAWWCRTLKNDQGQVTGALSSARDITEQRKIESEREAAFEALRRNEAQLSNALKIARLGPWEYDLINNVFIFNDAFYAIFRTTAKQVGGYTMSPADYVKHFVHPEDADLVAIETRKAVETDDPYFSRQVDHRIIYADGEVGYITVRFFIVKDKNGRTVRTYGVNQDITERKKAEEKAKIFFQAIENAYDSFIVVDMQGNVSYANESAPKTFGYSAEELMKLNVNEFTQNPEVVAQIIKEVEAKGSWSGETTAMRKNKETFAVMLSVSFVKDDKGKPIGMMGIFRDISENKKLEEKLKNHLNELEAFYKVSMGREERIIELKKEVENLKKKLGEIRA